MEIITALIPLGFAAAFQPPQIIALLVLLQSKRSAVNGLAFIAGMFVFRLVLGFGFWFLASGVEEAIESTGGRFGILVNGVLIVLGLLLLVKALGHVFSRNEEDQTAASWLGSLEDVSPLRAGLVGIAVLALDPKDWILDLAVVNLIADADLGGGISLLAYLLYMLLAKSLLLMPFALMLVSPKRAKKILGDLNSWMKAHAHTIEIITLVIFGLMFIWFGLVGLGVI